VRAVLGLGFIGQAVSKRLSDAIPIRCSSKDRNLDKNPEWLHLEGVETLYLCAGRTGGVGRMSKDPMSFVYPNVRIHMNVFEACVKARVKRVVCVGSTTGYPDTPEAVSEDRYLEGELHPAYEIPGNAHRFIKRLADWQPFETVFFRPSNVYGPGNSFDPQFSHVIEATVRKVSEKQNPFVIWGTGNETRDAIYIDDLAEAISYGETCPPGDYNVGSGEEMSVNQIVDVLLGHAGFIPDIEHDLSKPTAIPARRVDCTKLRNLGWRPKVGMSEGLQRTYDWFQTQSSKD
jgi:GDP-L-fucose synthase